MDLDLKQMEIERLTKRCETQAKHIKLLEALLRKLRERVGEGFRDEVREFSASIKGLLALR